MLSLSGNWTWLIYIKPQWGKKKHNMKKIENGHIIKFKSPLISFLILSKHYNIILHAPQLENNQNNNDRRSSRYIAIVKVSVF